MSDRTPLDAAVERLADRFRALPASRLTRVAADGLTLVRELSTAAQRLERPGARPLLPPDDGMYVIGDQLAVVGHDLAAALAEAGDEGDEVLDWALRKVAELDRRL
ncbi:hypothetical protein [Streptomyces sp. ICBB 8177]|uniref:hypothetical protein n=1 Tax=Streptomyces sp. ICBB 8177 TaxID=563922 RepID=UPI000D682EDA|nr:hypothetical protein [Streptomyces sp. ICBB 8177]PWI46055.1 hypothetical protein CK485_02690 [Streptomyces sp. ICBB 8177]